MVEKVKVKAEIFTLVVENFILGRSERLRPLIDKNVMLNLIQHPLRFRTRFGMAMQVEITR